MAPDPPRLPLDWDDYIKSEAEARSTGDNHSPQDCHFIDTEGPASSTFTNTDPPRCPSPGYSSIWPPQDPSGASGAITSVQKPSQVLNSARVDPTGLLPRYSLGSASGSSGSPFQPLSGAPSVDFSTQQPPSPFFINISPPGFPPKYVALVPSQAHPASATPFGHQDSPQDSTFANTSRSTGYIPSQISEAISQSAQGSDFANTSPLRPPPDYSPRFASATSLQDPQGVSAPYFGNQQPPQGPALTNTTPLGFPPGFPTAFSSRAPSQPPPGASATIFGNRHSPIGSNLRRMSGKCFSITSTRVYDPNLHCDRCGRGSDLGFFYRCVHNADARLFESIAEGNQEHFDEIGAVFSQQLKAPARGAAARQDKLSPLKEMTHQQLETYSAPQLATVLRQHEEAVSNALADRHGPFIPPSGQKPYLEPLRDECKATLCPACGRAGAGEDLSFLSIDGVLKGDIPPSAAVGYGFRGMGGRPVADANIVKNLGLRDPKTGLLPHQSQKIKEEQEREAAKTKNDNTEIAEVTASKMLNVACETVPSAGSKQAEGATKDAMTAGHKTDVLVELTASLNIDDDEALAAVEPDNPKSPSNSLADADESSEDVIQFYVDSSEDTTIGNCVRDVEDGA